MLSRLGVVLCPPPARGLAHLALERRGEGVLAGVADLPVAAWAGAAANGLPPAYAGMLGGLFDVIRGGHDAHLSTGVQDALGRPPASLADWAAREVRRAAS